MLGIRLGQAGAWCDLLLHVSALPETGPLDPDPRRILRLTRPGQVSVLLRTDRTGAGGYGPVIPLGGLDEVEDFFASLSWSDAMYGWKFFDDLALVDDWPARPSLSEVIRPGTPPHSLHWFSECGRTDGEEGANYLIEGTVTFDGIEVMRADETPCPLDEFIADGRRQWAAFFDGDPRLSGDAQHAAQNGAPSWRPYAGSATD